MFVTINENKTIETTKQNLLDFLIELQVPNDEVMEKFTITAYLPHLNKISLIGDRFGVVDMIFKNGEQLSIVGVHTVVNKLIERFDF